MAGSLVRLSVAAFFVAVCLFVLVAASPSIPGSGGVASVIRPALVTEANATRPPGVCIAAEDGEWKKGLRNGRHAWYQCRHDWFYGWDWWFRYYV